MTMIYGAGACLVVAQILGIYGLATRKADLIFSVCMITLVTVAVALGAVGAYHQLG